MKTKTFKTEADLEAWMKRNTSRYQMEIVFVENAYGVIYKPLRVIDFN